MLAICGLAAAQRATVVGAVLDQNGGAVAGVHLTLLNLDQGLNRGTTTNDNGYYSVPLLQPGRYVVTAQKDGFAIAEIENVTLHVGDVLGLNIRLQVSATPVQIQVSGKAQQVETVSPALGDVVTGDVVRNAPLNGRDIRDLAVLQPGVTPVDLDASGASRFSVAGNRGDSVTYLLDGGLNNDLIDNRAIYIPNPDTVSEFRIMTSNYPAEFGRNAGGVITVATQSGTNQLHGTVFDFLRNDALDANSFANKNAGLPRDVLKRNQFGGTLGGPLTIPHLMEGKDRHFFFVGYQGQRQSQDQVIPGVTTFTPQELGGDFSGDPNVASFLMSHPFFQPDPNLASQGVIAPSQINSVAQNYISHGLIPTTTSPSGLITSQGRFTINTDELTGKLDFDLDTRNKLAVTLGWDRFNSFEPFNTSASVLGYPSTSRGHDYLLNAAYTHIFSSNVLNELRATVERAYTMSENPARVLAKPADLGIGITPDLATGPSNLIFFDNNLSLGFSTIGPQTFADNTFSYSDTLTWNRGKHSWKFGGGLSAYQNNTFFAFRVNGVFIFLGTPFGSGNSLADFLLGLPLQYTQLAAAPSNIRSKFSYGFVQDEWRVRKNLALTFGLRYEYSTPKSDTQGRTFSIVPGRQSTLFPNAPPGMIFPGDAGAPDGVNFPDHNDWAPRVGFAWDPHGDGKTSLRGAFGVFYDILKAEDNLQFNGDPPFYASAGFQFPALAGNPTSEVNYLTQPFAAVGTPNPFPSHQISHNLDFAAEGFLPIGSSGSTFVVDPHLRTPYTYQYHFTLQREIAHNTVAEASYVGSNSHRLTALVDVNPFVLGSFNRRLNLTSPSANCGVNAAFLCYSALPEFRNAATASYNALFLSLQKQFSDNGFFGRSYFTLSYTYSHNIDNSSGFRNRNNVVPVYQPDRFRASADSDMQQRLVFSGGWELPVDRAWVTGPERVTRGWKVFPIVVWRTGFPLDVFANLPSSFDPTYSPGPSAAGDSGLVRANLVAPIQGLDPHLLRSINGQRGYYWFNPNSFSTLQCDPSDPACTPGRGIFPSDVQAVANPAVRTYGTLPRNAFRGPGLVNLDLAFAKSTPISDKARVEVRADFFNLFNHTKFLNPDTTFGSPTFGQLLNAFPPRIIQLSLRVSF